MKKDKDPYNLEKIRGFLKKRKRAIGKRKRSYKERRKVNK